MEYKQISLTKEEYVRLMSCFGHGHNYFKRTLEEAERLGESVSFWEEKVEECERVLLKISK